MDQDGIIFMYKMHRDNNVAILHKSSLSHRTQSRVQSGGPSAQAERQASRPGTSQGGEAVRHGPRRVQRRHRDGPRRTADP